MDWGGGKLYLNNNKIKINKLKIYSIKKSAKKKKKVLLPFATAWMELELIMLSEISQVVKDKYHIVSPLTGT